MSSLPILDLVVGIIFVYFLLSIITSSAGRAGVFYAQNTGTAQVLSLYQPAMRILKACKSISNKSIKRTE